MTTSTSAAGKTTESSPTFRLLMTRSLQSQNTSTPTTTGSTQKKTLSDSGDVIKALADQLGQANVPLNLLRLDPADFPRLREVLKKTGLTDEEIDSFMKRLGDEPVTMDRVMAALGSGPESQDPGSRFPIKSLPQLGRFLQDCGLESGAVKDIVSDLGQDRAGNAQSLREALLRFGEVNLKDITLADVDQNDLKELLVSLNMDAVDFREMQKYFRSGRNSITMDRFLDLLDSLEQSPALSPDEQAAMVTLTQNLKLDSTIRVSPYFNQAVALLCCLGEDEVEQDFPGNNPAMEVLRSGAAPEYLLNSDTSSAQTPEVRNAGDSTLTSDPLVQQVADRILYSYRHNRHHARIQLEPPELGGIKINLVYKDNQLQANIVAKNGFVKDSLDQHVAQLKNILAQHNLNLDRFEVTLDEGQQRNSGWNWSRNRHYKTWKENNVGHNGESASTIETDGWIYLARAKGDGNSINLLA